MTSREEFRKYRSAAHKQEINIHGGTYSDVPNVQSLIVITACLCVGLEQTI